MKSLISPKKSPFQSFSLPNAYGTTVLICLGLGLGTLVLQGFIGVAIFRLARKPPPVLVQTIEGESWRVKAISAMDRDSESIKRFTGEILTMMLSWNGYLPPVPNEPLTKPQLDPGVKLSQDNKQYTLPTRSWEASFALEPLFRQKFLPQLAQFVPKSVFDGQTTVFYMPSLIGEPSKVGEGQWKLDVVGTLYVLRNDAQLGEVIPFNRTVYVRAITPMFTSSLPVESQNAQLAQKVAVIRQAALEIYAMTDLENKDIGGN